MRGSPAAIAVDVPRRRLTGELAGSHDGARKHPPQASLEGLRRRHVVGLREATDHLEERGVVRRDRDDLEPGVLGNGQHERTELSAVDLRARHNRGMSNMERAIASALRRVPGTRPLAGNGRGGRIRTDDLMLPKHVRYQAALRPDGARTA